MRYFIELSYHGKNYNGWQIQPNAPSVQETIQQAIFTITRENVEITGCGRTDTGVHAKQYFAHVDLEKTLPPHFLARLNKVLPIDISIHRWIEVAPDAHTRFDAYHRAYEYYIDGRKNPFNHEIATFIYNFKELDREKMQAAAKLLLAFQEFAPFCKSDHDAKTLICTLYESEWIWYEAEQRAVYRIAANRFLRGMVRLIVGMCLNVGAGKITLAEVRTALENQTLLPKSSSAAPQGLFLTDIKYPYL
jgi:tRNA pseudouridine38-40 synthase